MQEIFQFISTSSRKSQNKGVELMMTFIVKNNKNFKLYMFFKLFIKHLSVIGHYEKLFSAFLILTLSVYWCKYQIIFPYI